MKLRNKKTGEIIGTFTLGAEKSVWEKQGKHFKLSTDDWCKNYDSLAELNEEWEDYEEPKEYWYVYGTSVQCGMVGDLVEDGFKQIGNYFETKEEAERAVEKLCAWKRLKDKGFRFDHWNKEYGSIVGIIAKISKDALAIDVLPDMNLLFGGEE